VVLPAASMVAKTTLYMGAFSIRFEGRFPAGSARAFLNTCETRFGPGYDEPTSANVYESCAF
jgi:hypothetical protein